MFKKVRKIKIFYKFLLILLFLSAVPLAIVGWRLININRLNLQDVILELHTKQATSVADKVRSYMVGLEEKLRFVVSSHGEPPINWTLTQRILRSMIAASNDFLTISTVSSEGRELTKVYQPSLEGKVKLESRRNDEVFKKAFQTKEMAASSIYYVGQTPRIDLVYPYTEDIFLYIEADMSELLETVVNSKIGQTGITYIVDNQGAIVMHPNIEMGINSVSAAERPIVQEVTSRRLLGSKEYVDESGTEIVGAYAPVSALDLGVIVEQDKDEAYLSVIAMRRNAIMFLIIVLVAASVAGYFMAQNLTSPIIKLTDTARNIAGGTFNVDKISRWLKNVKLKDEVAELASTFIVMTQQLKRYNEMQADKMNAIIYSIADGIIMTDYSGVVILSNKQAKELLKIDSRQELKGKKIQDIIQKKEITESLKEVREKEENIAKEIDLSGEDMQKHLRVDTSPVSSTESGAKIGTVSVIRDITLEKELEKLKDEFTHSITHDLRSPMTSIRGFLEFLLDESAGEINDQQREFLKIIDKSSLRLLDMINNILDIAKMETGSMPMELSTVNFKNITEEVFESLESQAKKDMVALNMDAPKDLPEVVADKNLIHRAITNLVSNSLKFTPEGGSVIVKLSADEDKVSVSVEDTGQGMPSEYVDKIFNKFEQVKGSKGKRKGTGLGLTITKYIVESHGGRIWAESELGKGSKFKFWISRNLKKDDE